MQRKRYRSRQPRDSSMATSFYSIIPSVLSWPVGDQMISLPSLLSSTLFARVSVFCGHRCTRPPVLRQTARTLQAKADFIELAGEPTGGRCQPSATTATGDRLLMLAIPGVAGARAADARSRHDNGKATSQLIGPSPAPHGASVGGGLAAGLQRQNKCELTS